MKKLILALLFLITSLAFSQTKYLIYFKDKGVSSSTSLQKSSSLYKIAEQSLSPKAIERRKQVLGENNYITYEDLPISTSYIRQIEALGIKIENRLKWFNAVSAYLTDEQLDSVKKLSSIEKVEQVKVYTKPNDESIITSEQPQTVPTNSLKKTTSLNYGNSYTQYNLSDIPTVHDLGIKGTDVIVGILDSGFRWTHNALKNLHVLYEKDFVQGDDVTSNQTGDASGQDSHGTACFSLIAGYDPGNIIGPAYDAKFILAKTENISSERNVEEDNYAAALEWMEGLGVNITTSSLGYTTFDAGQSSYTYSNMNGNTAVCTKALNIAFNLGVLTFTAAGNDGSSTWHYIGAPADAFNVITVGSVTYANTVSSFSSYGPTYDGRTKPEVVTMGSSDYVAVAGGNYSFGNGTSYATPIAAGIGALLKSCWPHLTNVQMRKIFLECGDNAVSPNNSKGWGLVSAKRVISYPNLSSTNGVYNTINKIFIDANGVNSSTVKLNYKIGSSSFQSVAMNYDGSLKYNYALPASTNGDQVEFYFTYTNNNSASVREPAITNYKFSYGSYNVSNLTAVENSNELPTQFNLLQNYPNPFNPETVISYQLSSAAHVTLKVFDILGREVKTLVNENQQAGNYNSRFAITNSQFPSGVYFYRLQAGDFTATKKMILLK